MHLLEVKFNFSTQFKCLSSFFLDISVIIAGDFRQLPPVAARSLYVFSSFK